MAPFLASLIARNPTFDPAVTSNEFKVQWVHPSDVFSVLLILGGDVVARALAQLAGGGLTPIIFSFGWVAYSVSALVSAVGENKLMPQSPDCKCLVINGNTGYSKENSSWIIGRIVRDFDAWSHPATNDKTNEILDKRWKIMKSKMPDSEKPTRAGLVVSIYKPNSTQIAGVGKRDMIYWSGFLVLILQLGVAAIPYGIFGDWGILFITVCGNSLAIMTGLLPQWKREKWACRTKSTQTYILTRGNGAQHAIVILGNGHGLNLEDLASGQSNIDVLAKRKTRVFLLALSILWILLLIAAAGLQQNTWFLLAIGAIGSFQNVFVAGCSRQPENFGIPLEFIKVFGKPEVMDTLFEVEENYDGVGRSMLDVFFPGKLRPHEIKKWAKFENLKAEPQSQAPQAGSAQVQTKSTVEEKSQLPRAS
ncbi:unnamed protein product [Penicillium bialowiezense]